MKVANGEGIDRLTIGHRKPVIRGLTDAILYSVRFGFTTKV